MNLRLGSSQVFHTFAARALITHATSLALVGCISTRVVGDNEPGDTRNETVEQTGDGTDCEFPQPADPACASNDEGARAEHAAWACSPNQLGALTGTAWHLESGSWSNVPAYASSSLTLRFGTDGRSSFEVGAPLAPVAEVGYLCSDRTDHSDYCSRTSEFPVGATYPLHGITQEGNGWKFEFRAASYLNEWCGLQTPRAHDECSFSLLGPNGVLFGPACQPDTECHVTFDGPDGALYGKACAVGSLEDGVYHVVEERDCGWAMLASKLRETCVCTSSHCYAESNSNDREWSLALDENGEVLHLDTGEEVQSFRRAD